MISYIQIVIFISFTGWNSVQPVTLLVLQITSHTVSYRGQNRNDQKCQERSVSSRILWFLKKNKKLWCYDISDTVTDKANCIHSRFFGVARGIVVDGG